MQPRFAADQTSASSVEKDPKFHDSAVGYHATNGELFGKRDPMPRTSCKQPAIATPAPSGDARGAPQLLSGSEN